MSYSRTCHLADEKATQEFALELIQLIDTRKQTTLYFQGQIGAGKTTLIRSLLSHLGVKETIKSPTFSLLEVYQLHHFSIYHFDLYRLVDPQELEFLGWRECFVGPSLCCVEWPEQAKNYLPEPTAWIQLALSGKGRELTLIKN
jgi:tRNA threonylcarbamoyladenosine biosynthesis protein TsaE